MDKNQIEEKQCRREHGRGVEANAATGSMSPSQLPSRSIQAYQETHILLQPVIIARPLKLLLQRPCTLPSPQLSLLPLFKLWVSRPLADVE